MSKYSRLISFFGSIIFLFLPYFGSPELFAQQIRSGSALTGDNIRAPKMKFERPGDYDTAAVQMSQQRSLESSGLLEREIDPQKYILGPNDRLMVSILLAQPQMTEVQVSPDGKIVIPSIGTISVRGASLAQAESLIVDKARKIFKHAEISVVLTKLRKFKVSVLGAVRRPMTVEATAVDRVSEVLERAGGIAFNGSLRRIKIFRNGGQYEVPVDLFKFYKTVDEKANPTVEGGDKVFVPQIYETEVIEIKGDVESPGVFEFVEGDSLSSLIEYAGGFTPSSLLDSVEFVRINTITKELTRQYLDMRNWSISKTMYNTKLTSGDRLYVRTRDEWAKRRKVVVVGEVKYPGEYAINQQDEKISSILARCGGFTSDAFIDGAVLIRQRDMEENDPEFNRLSRIPMNEMTESEQNYFKAKSREIRGLMAVDFRNLSSNSRDNDIAVKDKDSIFVPTSRNYITVLGRVNRPGRIMYKPSLQYEDYLAIAGGYAYRSDESNTIIIKSKGEQFLAKSKKYTLEPGDSIQVPEESETKLIDVLTKSLTITAQIITIIAVVISLRKI